MRAQAYPPLFISGGLNDPRVTYWEPAKWAAKLRATKTDDNVLLLKTNMGAGHGGKSGRFESLREAAEEVGLDPRLPQVLGRLPPHVTGTGYHVVPVVALLRPPFTVTPDAAEVAEIFEYPLARLLDPAEPQRLTRLVEGRERTFWVWPHEQHLVWGATAAILRNLALLLRG